MRSLSEPLHKIIIKKKNYQAKMCGGVQDKFDDILANEGRLNGVMLSCHAVHVPCCASPFACWTLLSSKSPQS